MADADGRCSAVTSTPSRQTDSRLRWPGKARARRSWSFPGRVLAFVLCILGISAAVEAAAREFVFVQVMSGGKICLVQKREGSCETVVARVAQAQESLRGAGITVSPLSCGEVAMAEARVIAERLRKAGLKGVFVIGFVSEPNATCAS